MLFHQLKTAWRNLIRQKGYTLINVLGLSVGIGASFVIYLITQHELCRDLLRLVGIAVLIASPIAWYGMRVWLRDFAYRVSISGWLFGAAALASLALALLTTSYQTIKAARANPIRGLRSE